MWPEPKKASSAKPVIAGIGVSARAAAILSLHARLVARTLARGSQRPSASWLSASHRSAARTAASVSALPP